MHRRLVCSAAAITTFLAACGEQASVVEKGESLPAPGSYRIVVGPEIRVSRDPHRPHTEMLIAANPRDVNNLVATSMTSPARAGGFSQIVFASHDGGNTWTSYEPPRLQETGGADPLIGFGPTGTAYFLPLVSALTYPPLPGERDGYDMYRSEDGGTTWTLTQTQAASGDHPMAAVDLTRGPHRGNLYVAAPGRVFRSTDDGHTMTDTFRLTPGSIANGGVMVLTDGSVVVALSPDEGPLGEGGRGHVTVMSTDGGKTWGPPAPVPIVSSVRSTSPPAVPPQRGILDLRLRVFDWNAFAADTAVHSGYRDRVYAAWTDLREDRARIVLITSGDRGRSWSAPVAVTPDGASFQFLPTLATNKNGVLGILYGDTRGFRAEDGRFNMYFAASLDGGASFLSPRRLSSRHSSIETEAHGRPAINHSWPYADSVSVWFIAILTKHPTGGDYLGLAADIDGVFHPMWADSRSGLYQAYTSRVAVLPGSSFARLDSALSEPVAVNNRVMWEVDPIRFDAATNIATLPVRLRNLSTDTIWGPISVRVKAINYRGIQPGRSEAWRLLNAENRVSGVGAQFDYTPALGDFRLLPPGGVSSPIEWRARFPELRGRHVRLQLDVVGRMRQ